MKIERSFAESKEPHGLRNCRMRGNEKVSKQRHTKDSYLQNRVLFLHFHVKFCLIAAIFDSLFLHRIKYHSHRQSWSKHSPDYLLSRRLQALYDIISLNLSTSFSAMALCPSRLGCNGSGETQFFVSMYKTVASFFSL